MFRMFKKKWLIRGLAIGLSALLIAIPLAMSSYRVSVETENGIVSISIKQDVVLAADTGVKYPATISTTQETGDDNDWVNPSNVNANDAAYASITHPTFDNGDVSYLLRATNFGFLVPSAAIIDGIVVEIERYYANGQVIDVDVNLTKNGTARVGSDYSTGANFVASPGSTVTFGGATNKWGTSWTVAEVNATTFGVFYKMGASANDADGFLDFIRITVYYTPSNLTIFIRPSAAGDETNLNTQFPSSTEHWDKVDETLSDNDITYVAEVEGGNFYFRDLYNLSDTAVSGTINWVLIWSIAKVTGGTLGFQEISLKTNGTAYNGIERQLTSSYVSYSDNYSTNPQTGVAWIWSEINALQAGLNLQGDLSSAIVTQLWIEVNYTADAVAITVSPTSYGFGLVDESTTTNTTTNYFTIDNTSGVQTDQTISVTTTTWSGGITWTHSDTATSGTDTAGLKANKGGTWGIGDVIIKYTSPNFIAENQAALTDYSFGLSLISPTVHNDGVQKTIVVRVTAVAG